MRSLECKRKRASSTIGGQTTRSTTKKTSRKLRETKRVTKARGGAETVDYVFKKNARVVGKYFLPGKEFHTNLAVDLPTNQRLDKEIVQIKVSTAHFDLSMQLMKDPKATIDRDIYSNRLR